MSPEQVLELAAMAWALVFAYLPVLKDKFAALSAIYKLLIQLGVFAVVVYGAFAGACAGLLDVMSCEPVGSGLVAATLLFVKVVIANQGMYQVTRLISKANGSE